MKRFLKRLLLFILIAGVLFTAYIYLTLPSMDGYTYRPETKTVIYSADGIELGEISKKNITYVSREEIPDHLANAVVAIEDKRYYKHKGVDLKGIIRAFFSNMKAGEIVEGGSTITQQVAKTLFFSTKQSYVRKAREALTALRLNRKFSKDEILTIYLNEIYLGGGAYGVYAASMTYFSKEPMELTLAECATLAGIIQAPSAYCPLTEEGYGFAMTRKDKVLDVMVEEGYISAEEAENAKAEKIKIVPTTKSAFSNGVCLEGCESYMNRVYDQLILMLSKYYVENMNYREEDARMEADNLLFSRDLTVRTTMNYGMQKNALKSIDAVLSDKDELATCALVSVDSDTGNVLAYYGSNTYLDMAQHPRQPGSTIKPLYMAYLLENNLADVTTVVNDARFDVGGYSPPNFGGKYYGNVTMRETLTHSLNCASLRFFLMGDIRQEIDFVKGLGISTIEEEDYNAAFALGGFSKGIKPAELALAYAAIDNGGMRYNINYVISLEDEEGKLFFPEDNPGAKVMTAETTAKLKSCLESVVLRGTAIVADPGYSTMGKTGTTDNGRDVWFAGSTGGVSTAIWAGNVDAKEVSGISSSWCSRIYQKTVRGAISDSAFPTDKLTAARSEEMTTVYVLKDNDVNLNGITDGDVVEIDVPTFEVPAFASRQVVKAVIDSSTGKLFVEGKCRQETKETRYYTKDRAPTEYCDKVHLFDFMDDWFR